MDLNIEPVDNDTPMLGMLIVDLADERVLNDVLDEVDRSTKLHGVQHLPDGTSAVFIDLANSYRRSCQDAFANGLGTHAHIVFEEFYEAMAETEWSKLRPELIQCLCVLLKWVKDGDQRARTIGG